MENPLMAIREAMPLVHHISNWVTLYDCANITRAVGALPVMAHAPEECEAMTELASALVLNIGTLSSDIMQSMLLSAAVANERNIPVVLDAVGAGATRYRDESCARLLASVRIDILKGNYSEIARLAGCDVTTKGVEAMSIQSDPLNIALTFAKAHSTVVVMTGKEDIVSDGSRIFVVRNGHDLMGTVVGTGCMATSVIGAFASMNTDYADASGDALCCFGVVGELAAEKACGPGSFKTFLYDEIFNLSDKKVRDMRKVEKR